MLPPVQNAPPPIQVQIGQTGVTVSDPLALNCEREIGDLAVGAVVTYECTLENVISSFTNVATASGAYGSTTVSDDDDAAELLAVARRVARRHVVVKRMLRAPELAPRPTRVYTGQTTRYDVYAAGAPQELHL